jgi:maltokinase
VAPEKHPAIATVERLVAEGALIEWLPSQRWYAAKARAVTATELLDATALDGDSGLVLAIVQAEFATGAHQLYQLPLGVRDPATAGPATLAWAGGREVYDALGDPGRALALLHRIEAGGELRGAAGRFAFRREPEASALTPGGSVRAVDVEQSNSSVVFSEKIMLKVYRRLEPGINPELEMLRFLTSHGFERIARLHGFYEYESPALAATLGVAQEFVAGASGGWEVALEQVGSEPDQLLELLGALGEVTATMHNALAADAEDPAFSPEEPSAEWLELLTATIDEEIEQLFLRLPEDERLAPIAGRGQDVRARLANRRRISLTGKLIRTHGDFHLGQTLHAPGGWVVIDFEGEPARSLSDRRRKRSVLRDVASMMRSFAYLGASARDTGRELAPNFESLARSAFLADYYATIDPVLLPAGQAAIDSLLSLFELERAIYELHYELEHRPDWVQIPVAAIGSLLESG